MPKIKVLTRIPEISRRWRSAERFEVDNGEIIGLSHGGL